ncbi:cytoplasmic dynein 1 light intermediate chain 2 [Anopheles arabiensis]|uniref:Dynein light intermediate chain n=5 Tax=gambiae species complex TaxID=44542 RepID=Q7QEC0_ANOGA|nr:cytoplasmic dynein 1 light intermediate chain 2 [Anopheles arabiensis]XP_040172530.1 cytoplasmic dynein 1 light intermediate chain 2 [Anopheles arabiensis]XP_040240369.1 cytoplasmic dynein 1 light intermediate chain 2 [Anopheles coluzzii]XP_040240370.1 cytoplasmic dynein 1 light intermediate chain 2 [Anopheles coluzzii]XP_041778859.1 cytoplasmic dynein 1 light intermediate chain 2 [Anopheles merus]XP_041778940.1 cytoplasmic dynein 1 light intermediate chain 2 [Anopheles merus]XP_041779029.
MEILTQSQVHGLTTPTTAARKKDAEAKENLWSSILSEVQTQSNTKLPSNKSVLVLGDNASGKTTLIAKLQGVEDPKKGSGLEYAYIDVRDEYRDDVTRLSVWILDGDPGHNNLLKFALNEQNFPHTLVILTLSMTTPWSWVDQLQHWMKILDDHIAGLKIDPEEKQQCQARLTTEWQNYCETIDDLDPGSPIKRTNRLPSVDDELDALPLPEGVLTTNLGLDVVVVVTKTDYMTTLEKELDYRDEHFDFMQQWIRRFCLMYGASLFYTSVKEDKNCDLLYKYLTHRIYGLPFRTPALVVEKDAVLIPAGWDNMKKISILYENMQSCKPDDYYNDIIAQPPSRKTVSNRESEIQTEDEQSFLARQQQLLQQGQSPARGESPLRSQPNNGTKSTQRTPVAAGAQGSPKKVDGKLTPGTQSGEGVLANFFNSLLHKKSVSPGSAAAAAAAGGVAGTGSSPLSASSSPVSSLSPRVSVLNGTGEPVSASDKLSMRTDAALELDRLARSVKKDLDISATQSDC